MGNNIRLVSDGVVVIAADDTWIEGKAIQQLETTARLPGMVQVAGMPDLHPGRGYPVGAAFFSEQRFYPALVGNDIGCGMALWQTDCLARRWSPDKLEKQLGNLDAPPDEAFVADELPDSALRQGEHARSLGTIGGGNHFAEWQRLDRIHDADAVAALGLSKEHLLLLVHSGSRGMGEAILREHVDGFGHHGLPQDTPAAEHYLARHEHALRFAVANRRLIARRMLARLHGDGHSVLDVNHNLVSLQLIGERQGWLHRKGATPSDQGVVVIPGSRGDYSYLVAPVPNQASLYSLAHGAGRKWMRSECKGRLSARYGVDQLLRTALGSRVICGDRELLFEEAPEAYKRIDSVIRALDEAGLVRVLARLAPVLTYKTRGGCC